MAVRMTDARPEKLRVQFSTSVPGTIVTHPVSTCTPPIRHPHPPRRRITSSSSIDIWFTARGCSVTIDPAGLCIAQVCVCAGAGITGSSTFDLESATIACSIGESGRVRKEVKCSCRKSRRLIWCLCVTSFTQHRVGSSVRHNVHVHVMTLITIVGGMRKRPTSPILRTSLA